MRNGVMSRDGLSPVTISAITSAVVAEKVRIVLTVEAVKSGE
jgi:hypothetical protein